MVYIILSVASGRIFFPLTSRRLYDIYCFSHASLARDAFSELDYLLSQHSQDFCHARSHRHTLRRTSDTIREAIMLAIALIVL